LYKIPGVKPLSPVALSIVQEADARPAANGAQASGVRIGTGMRFSRSFVEQSAIMDSQKP
jgi:hypothetical protein